MASVSQRVICAFVNCADKELALSMLRQLSGGPFDVLMLDNGGYTAEQIQDSGYNVQVVQTPENVRWGPAVNVIMEWVIENRPECKAVWVCNDDITGANQNMASVLYATLSATGAAVVSPACNQSNIKAMHRIGRKVVETAMIDFVSPLISVEAWKKVGALDTELLGVGWGLDIDWCYRARELGYKFFVDEAFEIVHKDPGFTCRKQNTIEEHQDPKRYELLDKKYGKPHIQLMNWVVEALQGSKRGEEEYEVEASAQSKRVLHVLMPSRGMLSVPSHVFLSNYNVWGGRSGFGQVHQHIPTGLPVAEAREKCLEVVEQWMDNMPDHEHWILWMDDDMDPPTNSVGDLRIAIESEEGKRQGIGIISGYCCRKEDHDPGLVFAPKTKTPLLPLVDFVPGEIVEVEWCGLGFALMKAQWIRDLPKPRFVPNWGGAEEDHNFTIALRGLGCKPFVHTGISIGHFSVPTQSTYFPYVQPAIRAAMNGKEIHPQAVAAALGEIDNA